MVGKWPANGSPVATDTAAVNAARDLKLRGAPCHTLKSAAAMRTPVPAPPTSGAGSSMAMAIRSAPSSSQRDGGGAEMVTWSGFSGSYRATDAAMARSSPRSSGGWHRSFSITNAARMASAVAPRLRIEPANEVISSFRRPVGMVGGNSSAGRSSCSAATNAGGAGAQSMDPGSTSHS